VYYTNQEERIINAAERLYISSYNRFVPPPPSRTEVALRFSVGYHRSRGIPITLPNVGSLMAEPRPQQDLALVACTALAKYRHQNSASITQYVVTTDRRLFTEFRVLSDIYRAYRNSQARGGSGWANSVHESVFFGMYMLYDGNTPAVFSVSAYMQLLTALTRQLHAVETGEPLEKAEDANQIFLNSTFAPANPLFVDPANSTGPKLKRLTCRMCSAPKLSSQTCLVCGFTPRQRS